MQRVGVAGGSRVAGGQRGASGQRGAITVRWGAMWSRGCAGRSGARKHPRADGAQGSGGATEATWTAHSLCFVATSQATWCARLLVKCRLLCGRQGEDCP